MLRLRLSLVVTLLFGLLPTTSAFAGAADIRIVIGQIGDFNQQTVEIRDRRGRVWAVDRSTFKKNFDIRPDRWIRVRVTEDHITLVDPSRSRDTPSDF